MCQKYLLYTSDGHFQKQCGCSIHVENPEEKYKILKTSSVTRKKRYKNLVDEGLIDRRTSCVCNVCLDFMPRQSKTKEKVSNQSNKSDDNNMDIDSDIAEEESINLIKNYVKIWNSANGINSPWKWKRVS